MAVLDTALETLEPSRPAEDAALYDSLVVAALRSFALAAARALGLCAENSQPEGRLFALPAFDGSLGAEIYAGSRETAARDLGVLLEGLLSHGITREAGRRRIAAVRWRKKSGSFFTPDELTLQVARAALEQRSEPEPLVCDPAVGGGAFLLAACDVLEQRLARRRVIERCLYGVDVSPLAVAVSEAALWLHAAAPELTLSAAGVHLSAVDALGASIETAAPEVFARAQQGFDLVIGNPPWVAYAGRAAQPLSQARRRALQRRYRSFKGYPTLHGLFVERASELAPNGTIALLLPSPLADLDGYRSVRRTLTATHVAREPLLEFGQDAFASVTQPCFALIADARGTRASGEDRPFRLIERQRLGAAAEEVKPPAVLLGLLERPPLPRELFGEMGFQSRRAVTEKLFKRGALADGHDYPLLEGKDVAEFRVGAPRLFLKPDRALLKKLGCRLREPGDYGRVRFVVRQTAKVPIAALHSGLPFRNTLLAGFDHPGFAPELVVGLLNSALYRALHLAARRDARQAVFPQVKVAHLRALPQPPDKPEALSELCELARQATSSGIDRELRRSLDQAVFDLFEVGADDRTSILDFVTHRAPELAHS